MRALLLIPIIGIVVLRPWRIVDLFAGIVDLDGSWLILGLWDGWGAVT